MRHSKTALLVCAAAAALGSFGAQPTITPGPGAWYATDAYPGFDSEAGILPRSRKEPGFFSWWSGPKFDSPERQLDWARQCAENKSYKAARKAYDALVAEWPMSPQAPVAQEELAALCFSKLLDSIDAFEEYKYLLDFYSSQCDYNAVVAKMYDVALAMREDGKRILFFRFANTVDVRRAFENVVVRAPGASFAPAAMSAAAELLVDDGELEKAVAVYENIRNLYPKSKEAKDAVKSEADARMKLLKDHGYNRARCKDTVSFLKMAKGASSDPALRETLSGYLVKASAGLEKEAYEAAKFYDSRTRTRSSAINAYERFLREYPASSYADVVRERLSQLKEGTK